nr:13921_t:CDS:2 [Entrophospora candida]
MDDKVVSNPKYPYEDLKRPTLKEKTNEVVHEVPKFTASYIRSLFPIVTWIGRYNLTWFLGDVVAGITVGAIAIPQTMAVATKLANLPPEYGLYSAFVGVTIYCLFATSRDVTIGPTAVMSLLIGQATAKIMESSGRTGVDFAVELATGFGLLSGIIILILGLFRFGFVVHLIPTPVITGFTTGSVITIALGQIAKLMGITGVNTSDPGYVILVETLKGLPRTKVDAALGIFSLIYLYAFKYGTQFLSKKYPKHERTFFFIGVFRIISIFIICTLFTFILSKFQKVPYSILGSVPSGFSHLGFPNVNSELLGYIGGYLPTITLVSVLEHVALTKCFGRINDYKIDPSQELVAIGVTNTLGSFFGGYPATGSFSRTAVKARSGVRTPLAGVFTAIIIISALFFLTPAFFYIPDTTLSAIIIHAVLGLVSELSYVKQLWKIQLGIFFSTIEIGIYASTLLTFVVIIFQLVFPRLDKLGILKVSNFIKGTEKIHYTYVPLGHSSFKTVENPPDGILIFRFDKPLYHFNSSYMDDKIIEYAKDKTRKYYKAHKNKGDRPWNDSKDTDPFNDPVNLKKPRLKAVIFDFSIVSVMDSTVTEMLIDLRKELDRYSQRSVEFHFANVMNENVQNSLIVGGFGKFEPKDLRNGSNSVKEVNVEATSSSKKFFHLSIEEALEWANS